MPVPSRFELWPRSFGTNVGNCKPIRISGTNLTIKALSFVQAVDGDAFGRCRIPDNLHATANAHVVLWIAAAATTGVTRLNIGTRIVGDGDAIDGSFTAETAQDITVPATSRLLKVVRFPAAGALTPSFTGAAGELLQINIQHLGAHANDTLDTIPTELLAAFLIVDTA